MSRERPTDLAAALAEMPLFPLHQVVLFPGVLLPLHVFEPRYRKLIEDIVGGHRTFAIPHVPDADADMAGNPPIAAVAGIGTIVEHVEVSGGRFDVVLLGRARVRLDELPFSGTPGSTYRRARATVLEPTNQDVPAAEIASLEAAATAFARLLRRRDQRLDLRIPRDATPGVLCDAYTHHLVLSSKEKQAALEMLDVRQRIRRVIEVLTVQRTALAPPDQSLN
jgi:Lon protease-like protein